MAVIKKNKIAKRADNKNGYLFILPYALAFLVFILIPVLLAIVLSFTNFNAIEFPSWVGFLNYITVLTNDEIFMQYVLPNTISTLWWWEWEAISSPLCWPGPCAT